ncbi:cell division protein FtsZ [Nonlabens sp. Hel1_33_55]|uniref:cell division protein FtsZ n=1 Tax=Nonlabens sp. Hel1_33_55 TaxID=1336802 RepID=UPI000875BDFB|nr:cell division protein FtsZ [Nonlabens sp. Hel1_33_55]SCY23862.1 cell division protein FtsZ [Nonlabens sp. Hel1_33_55]
MSNDDFNSIAFDLPKNQSNVIKVIGVGGGGSNAIKHMFQQGIIGVDFVICNTDSQALENSPVPNKIQLGVTLTEGLGAGANPEVGERAAQESIEDVRAMMDSRTKMVFITAGMGGGTGTGAAPIIAQVAREMDILTVGIVTTPFHFEGKVRNEQAQKGIEKFRKNVDSLVIINNNKLRDVYGNLGFKAGFSKADEVLATASRGIAEVITNHYTQNIDLRDAKTVLSNSGTAIMGSAQATGSNRAQEGILKALDSPLLNDNKITGAKNVLLLIVSGTEEITIDEIGEINEHIQNEAGGGANIIMGVGEDESLGDAIAVTVIATGFNAEQQNEISNTEGTRIIHTLEEEQRAIQVLEETNERVVAGTLIMDEEVEEKKEDDKESAFAKAESQPAPSISKDSNEPVIIMHELGDEEPEETIVPKNENPLIPTTEFIKNLNVVYEEVLDQEPQLVIKEEVVEEQPVVYKLEEIEDEEDQFLLDFDLPLSEKEEPNEEQITYNLEEIEVNDPVEIIPITEVSDEGIRKYSLDDYMEVEKNLNNATKSKEQPKAETKTERINIRTVEVPVDQAPVTIKKELLEDLDPTDLPINEVLKLRAEERKRKMHAYNFKFKSSHRLEEIEKKPAYLRHGIELDETPTKSDRSRTTLNTDENNDIQLRGNNNSFLHDNVD